MKFAGKWIGLESVILSKMIVLQPGYVVISMAHIANKGHKKLCLWIATCGRAGVYEICAGTLSTSVACTAFCSHGIIQTEGNEDAWGLDSSTGKLTLSLIGKRPHTHFAKLASPLNMGLGELALSLTWEEWSQQPGLTKLCRSCYSDQDNSWSGYVLRHLLGHVLQP